MFDPSYASMANKLTCHSVCAPPHFDCSDSPILEMVTEKYLLREEEETNARRRSVDIMDELLMAFKRSDVRAIARLVTENFLGPIRAVIPFASNVYTETLIERMQEHFGENFWG
jgi:hypothetical protein